MRIAFFRGFTLMGCASLALAAGACSSSSTGADGAAGAGGTAGAAGGNATGGGGTGGGGSGGAAGARADAAVSDAFFPGGGDLFTFSTAADVAAAGVSNPADTNKGDLGVYAAADGGPRATLALDATVGDPDPGSLEIQLPCNAYGQFVDYQFILPVISDLGQKTLSVMIRLDSGFSPDPAVPGSVYLYAKSGDNWDWGQGVAQPVVPTALGQWTRYTFPMTHLGPGSTAAFDPGYIKAVGVHIDTGGGGGATGLPTPAVFHVDSIGYQ